MHLDVKESLKQGFSDILSRKGVLLTALFFVSYLFIETVVRSHEVAGYDPGQYTNIDPSGTYLLPNGPVVEGLIGVAGANFDLLFMIALFLPLIPTVMAFRGFNGKSLLPGSWQKSVEIVFFLTLVNFIALLGILFGSIFFVLPGVYLAVSLVFFPVLICAEGEGIESLKTSWKLTEDNKVRIFGLMLVLLVVTTLPGFILSVHGLDLTSIYISSIETVFGIATISAAYRQLRGEKE